MTENLNKKDKNWIICQELGKCSATENFCQQDVVACGKWFTKGAYHFLNRILNQGNLLKGIDKKTVRREAIEPITIVYKEKKRLEIAVFFMYNFFQKYFLPENQI